MQCNLYLIHLSELGVLVYKHVNSGLVTFTIYFLPPQNFAATFKFAEAQRA